MAQARAKRSKSKPPLSNQATCTKNKKTTELIMSIDPLRSPKLIMSIDTQEEEEEEAAK